MLAPAQRQSYSPAEVRLVRKLRYRDGRTAAEVAAMLDMPERTVYGHAPGRLGKIDNAKLRAAFERSGLTAQEVARHAGWYCTNRNGQGCPSWGPDVSRVRRTLGLIDDVNGRGLRSRRRLVDAEKVALLAEAIGVAPWEVGY